jgi:hypothetical protein
MQSSKSSAVSLSKMRVQRNTQKTLSNRHLVRITILESLYKAELLQTLILKILRMSLSKLSRITKACLELKILMPLRIVKLESFNIREILATSGKCRSF